VAVSWEVILRRVIALSLLACCTASCEPAPPPTLSTATSADQVGSVCADPVVIQALISMIGTEGDGDITSHLTLSVDAITVESLDAERHELICHGSIAAKPDEAFQAYIADRSAPVAYAVRPSVTPGDGPYVVSTDDLAGVKDALGFSGIRQALEIDAAKRQREAEIAAHTGRNIIEEGDAAAPPDMTGPNIIQ
jgi:hypothetical protein